MKFFSPNLRRSVLGFTLVATLLLPIAFPRPAAAAQTLDLGCAVNQIFGADCSAINIAPLVSNVVEVGLTAASVALGGSSVADALAGTPVELPGGRRYLGAVDFANALSDNFLANGYPNLHTASFFKQTLANNILVQPAFATTGEEYFDPIKTLWDLMRNIAYAFSAVFLAVMGVMVMMRTNINPRTVMTATAAIPRMLLALVLITFSFPIAGLIVDLGRVVKELIKTSIDGMMAGHGGVENIAPFGLLGGVLRIDALINLGKLHGFLGTVLAAAPGVSLIVIVLSIILLAVSLYLSWVLIKLFAGLFVSVVFAPWAFLWGALPGQEDTTTRWFKGFLAKVLSFPVIYLLVNLARYLSSYGAAHGLSMPSDLGWGTALTESIINLAGVVALGLVIAATKVPAVLEDILAVTPSGSVAKAGIDVGKVASRIPVVGKILK